MPPQIKVSRAGQKRGVRRAPATTRATQKAAQRSQPQDASTAVEDDVGSWESQQVFQADPLTTYPALDPVGSFAKLDKKSWAYNQVKSRHVRTKQSDWRTSERVDDNSAYPRPLCQTGMGYDQMYYQSADQSQPLAQDDWAESGNDTSAITSGTNSPHASMWSPRLSKRSTAVTSPASSYSEQLFSSPSSKYELPAATTSPGVGAEYFQEVRPLTPAPGTLVDPDNHPGKSIAHTAVAVVDRQTWRKLKLSENGYYNLMSCARSHF